MRWSGSLSSPLVALLSLGGLQQGGAWTPLHGNWRPDVGAILSSKTRRSMESSPASGGDNHQHLAKEERSAPFAVDFPAEWQEKSKMFSASLSSSIKSIQDNGNGMFKTGWGLPGLNMNRAAEWNSDNNMEKEAGMDKENTFASQQQGWEPHISHNSFQSPSWPSSRDFEDDGDVVDVSAAMQQYSAAEEPSNYNNNIENGNIPTGQGGAHTKSWMGTTDKSYVAAEVGTTDDWKAISLQLTAFLPIPGKTPDLFKSMGDQIDQIGQVFAENRQKALDSILAVVEDDKLKALEKLENEKQSELDSLRSHLRDVLAQHAVGRDHPPPQQPFARQSMSSMDERLAELKLNVQAKEQHSLMLHLLSLRQQMESKLLNLSNAAEGSTMSEKAILRNRLEFLEQLSDSDRTRSKYWP